MGDKASISLKAIEKYADKLWLDLIAHEGEAKS